VSPFFTSFVRHFSFLVLRSLCRYGDWSGHLEYTWSAPAATVALVALRAANDSDSGRGDGRGDLRDARARLAAALALRSPFLATPPEAPGPEALAAPRSSSGAHVSSSGAQGSSGGKGVKNGASAGLQRGGLSSAPTLGTTPIPSILEDILGRVCTIVTATARHPSEHRPQLVSRPGGTSLLLCSDGALLADKIASLRRTARTAVPSLLPAPGPGPASSTAASGGNGGNGSTASGGDPSLSPHAEDNASAALRSPTAAEVLAAVGGATGLPAGLSADAAAALASCHLVDARLAAVRWEETGELLHGNRASKHKRMSAGPSRRNEENGGAGGGIAGVGDGAASQHDMTANVLHSLPAHRRKRMRELFDFFDKARPWFVPLLPVVPPLCF